MRSIGLCLLLASGAASSQSLWQSSENLEIRSVAVLTRDAACWKRGWGLRSYVMAAFKKVMPVLRVADLPEAIDWYTRLLGFELCWRAPNDGGGETCMMEAGEVTLMLSTGPHLGRRPGFSGTFYFEMTGVREFFAKIRDEVEIVWPVGETEYGTVEFGVKDPDGYMLAFAEQIAAGPGGHPRG